MLVVKVVRWMKDPSLDIVSESFALIQHLLRVLKAIIEV